MNYLETVLVLDQETRQDRIVALFDPGTWDFNSEEKNQAPKLVQDCLNSHEAIAFRARDLNGPTKHEFPAMMKQLRKKLTMTGHTQRHLTDGTTVVDPKQKSVMQLKPELGLAPEPELHVGLELQSEQQPSLGPGLRPTRRPDAPKVLPPLAENATESARDRRRALERAYARIERQKAALGRTKSKVHTLRALRVGGLQTPSTVHAPKKPD